MHSDTLQIDHQMLKQLQESYPYANDVEVEKPSILSELLDSLEQWLEKEVDISPDVFDYIVYGISILAVLILITWMVRSGQLSKFFKNQGKAEVSIEEAEENIHVVDFEKEIARAVAAGDFTRASRLLYLQTLKHLSDRGRMEWQPQKTPTQYAMEVKDDAFTRLTHLFLPIRYGGFEADEPLFESMKSLKNETMKGGTA